ncbi:hypothetical protein Btru_019433 [Bulinus truncatus]|nr:hypothetical protein Btru_019433 [Bulinus truncatus]
MVLCFSDFTYGRWCTRLVRKHHVETDFVMAQCKRSYTARCGWFSSQMCTYYELHECPIQHNRTVEKYQIVEECCPGYILDPINNITCIKENEGLMEEVTTIESIIETELSNHSAVGSLHYGSSDTIFGLSHGAYAGIVCTLLFFICVIILVVWHVHKRKRIAKFKESKLEICVTEKMITPHT